MAANPEDFDASESKLTLAKQLIHLVWGSGEIPATFNVEYEGANWEVVVRVKQTEDARLVGRNEADFTEELPE
jgi:hypothetical protein